MTEQRSIHGRRRWRVVAGALAACLSAGAARADFDPPPLSGLLSPTPLVAVGTVTVVGDPPPVGPAVATIAVSQVLAGVVPGTVTIPVDAANPEALPIAVGQRLVAFLRQSPGQGWSHEPLGPEGLMLVSPATEARTVALLSAALQRGGLSLAAVMPLLVRGDDPPARPLVRAILDELAQRDLSGETAALITITCDANGAYLPAVRHWAMAEAGRRHVVGARLCLAGLAKAAVSTKKNVPPGDMTLGQLAVTALGDDPATENDGALRTVMKACVKKLRTEDTPRPSALCVEATLALGKLHSAGGASLLYKAALKSTVVPWASTAVHALGLVGDAKSKSYLLRVALKHPIDMIRQQAAIAAARLGA